MAQTRRNKSKRNRYSRKNKKRGIIKSNKYNCVYQVDHIIDTDYSKKFLKYIKSVAESINLVKGCISHEILKLENNKKNKIHFTVIYRFDNINNLKNYLKFNANKFKETTKKMFNEKLISSRKIYNVEYSL